MCRVSSKMRQTIATTTTFAHYCNEMGNKSEPISFPGFELNEYLKTSNKTLNFLCVKGERHYVTH